MTDNTARDAELAALASELTVLSTRLRRLSTTDTPGPAPTTPYATPGPAPASPYVPPTPTHRGPAPEWPPRAAVPPLAAPPHAAPLMGGALLMSPPPMTPPPGPWSPAGGWPAYPTTETAMPRRTLAERIGQVGFGSHALAWVGGGVTLVGVVLLLVLAVQRGYLGPVPRLVLGATLAVALVATAVVLRRRSGQDDAVAVGALATAATGFAVAYLDVVAATAIYDYLPVWAGLTAALVTTAAGVALASRWGSQLFATFVVGACAISAPVLTGAPSVALVGFLLMLHVGATPVQLARRWPVLSVVAAVPPVLGVLSLVDRPHGAVSLLAICGAVAGIGGAAAIVTAARRPDDPWPTPQLLAAGAPVLVAAGLTGGTPAALTLAIVAAVAATAFAVQQSGALVTSTPLATATGALAALAAFEATCVALHGDARAIALLGGGLAFALLAGLTRLPAALPAAALFGGFGSLLAVAGRDGLRLIVFAPSGALPGADVLTLATTSLAVVAFAGCAAWSAARTIQVEVGVVWGGCGVLALYGTSGAVLSAGLAVSPDRAGFLAGHVAVTVSWTIAALALLVRRTDSAPWRVAGLAFVAAALAKLVLFDLATLQGIPRVLVFLGAGLVLLGAGARYATVSSGPDDDPAPADAHAPTMSG